jgi:hypothetical protein
VMMDMVDCSNSAPSSGLFEIRSYDFDCSAANIPYCRSATLVPLAKPALHQSSSMSEHRKIIFATATLVVSFTKAIKSFHKSTFRKLTYNNHDSY